MNFNQHWDLKSKHAFLSGSNHHWINYDEDRLREVYKNVKAKEEGTQLHAFAAVAIEKRIKLAPLKRALNMFVNDAIGFGMTPEQVLYYSDNCFGTADAILFNNDILRIHDLKTGITRVSFNQLDIYSAMFCLEYGIDPYTIIIQERIYQNNGFEERQPDPEDIKFIMDKIVSFDMIVDEMKYMM